MTSKHKPDKTLFFLILFLIFCGLLILASASLVKSQMKVGENYYYLKHQFIFGTLIGLGLFFSATKFKYSFWKKISFPIFVLSLLILILLFLPRYGMESKGATRWLGFGNLSFQPSEFAKLGVIIYLSAWLSKRKKQINSLPKTIFPFLMINAFLAVLFLLQPDMGGLMIVLGCSYLLLFLVGAKKRYLAVIAILGIILFLFFTFFSSYRLPRLKSFLSPGEDPLASGYQIRQALIGIGSGGILGKGYGQSFQKTGYLPEVIGDSIFVVLIEEMGLVAGVILVFSYLALFFRGMRIAKRAPDDFGFLLAIGISSLIIYQAFINIAAISGLSPLTGMTLPLVSYGGSSYLVTLLSLGILFNISCYTKTRS
ncbi:putative lipid II flippase FtsW [bacterium]|nr:MAG: putative lipid II flippase FtsW [bacterium]